jgi:hypothetical protein
MAKSWFMSLEKSGHSVFYEPSDWQAALFVGELMSRQLKSKDKPSAGLFQGIWTAMGDLLTTEASRRRMKIEIERGDEDGQSASVTALDEYRKRLAS